VDGTSWCSSWSGTPRRSWQQSSVRERRTLRLAAKPKLAGLKVNAVDEQGNDLEPTVRVDSKEVGEAGATLKVPVCSREVSLRLGNAEWREELKLEEGQVTLMTAKPGSGKAGAMVALAGGASVKAARCSEPSTGEFCNWRQPGREQHPINCVNWRQAHAYCKAQGKRLPPGEGWEFAASNGGSTKFPWGNSSADATRARWNSHVGTAPVGTYASGATQSRLQDLSGNVLEWMANEYSFGRDARGGSWRDGWGETLRASYRNWNGVSDAYDMVGSRCAQ
jgi:formylglycine-generating enzyme required for sulfatase activity